MPDGGYGLNQGDQMMLKAYMAEAKRDETVKAMWFEWMWAYASARGAGAEPADAARAAYTEWDL